MNITQKNNLSIDYLELLSLTDMKCTEYNNFKDSFS